MPIDRTNKWGLGLLFGPVSPFAATPRYRIFRSSALVATTLLVCCVAFGEAIGIREPYLQAFRWITAILFLIAAPRGCRSHLQVAEASLQSASLLTALLMLCPAALALCFPF